MGLFNRIAHRYDDFVGKFTLEEIIELMPLKSDALLIDLGGGTGRLSSQLLNYVDECFIIDFSYEMMLEARKKSDSISLVQGIGEELPLRSDSVNQIFMNDSLHHIQLQDETLKECNRVLIKGGELIIREIDKSYFWNIFIRFFEWIVRFKSKFLSAKQLAKKCSEAGFENITCTKSSKTTYILIATKP